jgi:hypothetical protein
MQDPSCANPIACENQLPGTPRSVWGNISTTDATISGFADPFSVNIGQSISFKISSPASSYAIDIYRIGYYGGDGARLVASITPDITVSQNQPPCDTNAATGLVDCGNWNVSATWPVPATAVSGAYIARIYRTDGTSSASHIPFVVTDNSSHSSALFMTSDETWQAYNDWGGYSLYAGKATGSPWCCSALDGGRAVQVSYNRPFAASFDTSSGEGSFFATEFPEIEFMEENGYDVSYVSQSDVAAAGAPQLLEQHKVFVNAGHSEYWDAGDRASVTAARDAGVNLAFFAGNLMYWKTRWAASQDGNEAYRTLITYKESLDTARSDPADPTTWTGSWRDPRFSPPDGGGQPENALTGQLWMVDCCSYADQVPAAYSRLRIWRNTAVANLQAGQTYTMPNETLGYEWDEPVDNGFQPAGEIDLSRTCENVSQLLLTPESGTGPGNACNSMTLYKAASGALVFDAGTVQWTWGLSSNHNGAATATDPAMQQATVNLLADMGAQPTTLESNLTPATASTDTTPPTSVITAPASGATFTNGDTVTVSGTATDSGGGVVAGVEVSTDGGATWHPATTMSDARTSVNWSYTWPAAGNGGVTIQSRATDDSGNIETPGPGVNVSVSCPCSLFWSGYTPSVTSDSDSAAYELGMKFQSAVAGWVAGVRFYKGAGNGGTHTGSLWTSSGTLLATGTFTNESASGWQTLTFASPVQIIAGTSYVVSYFDPDGHYAFDQDLFDVPLGTPPLTAPKASYTDPGGGNGVFHAGGAGFPASTYGGSSYAVDVIFDTTQPATPPAVSAVTPAAGSAGNPVSVTPTATFSQPVTPGTVSFTITDSGGNAVPGSVAFNGADTTATFTPAAPLTASTSYTAVISGAQNTSGTPMTAPYTWTFTTGTVDQCPCSIWQDAAPAGATDADDTSAVTLGLQFKPASDGTITGIRFYKEADNTGPHTGDLWTTGGTLLATGTFTGETASGWQELDFTTPVPVTAGTTYVASYHTSTGHYAITPGALAAPVTNGPLTAAANGGVYAYGSTDTLPTSTFNAANYWVDIVYTSSSTQNTPPAVSAVTPAAGSAGNPVSVTPTATFSQPVTPGTVSFTITDSGGNAVPGSVAFNGADTTATFTPAAPLTASTSYTAVISGAQNTSGTPMTAPYTWTFTTGTVDQCPCSIWQDAAPAGATDADDTSAVTLGLQFKPASDGTITGIRFYKEADNTGPHTGDLWTTGGTLLATGTFTGETASGWQELDFTTPVPVTAGTTYVASYHTSTGHYAITPGALAAPVTNGPLTAAANGGVYAYGSTDTLPTSTFNAANYWVDIVYSPS